MPQGDEVSRMLREAGPGREASSDLLPLVYDQLRAIARRRMGSERADHTLQPTALVHEAFLRLVGDGAEVGWDGRGHFYAAAAEAMRRILIEHARARGRDKRGGGAHRVPMTVLQLATEGEPDDVLSIEEAVRRLEARDERLAKVVELRFYAGLSEQEAAGVLGLSARTVRRDWVLARAWLARELGLEEERS